MSFVALIPPIYFNAKQYGAVCNGTTDDTTALSSAISAASAAGGGYVFLPGMCAVSTPITLPANVRLIGAGFGTGLKPLASFTGTQIVLCNGNNSGVQDIQIAYANTTYSTNPTANGIQVTGATGVLLQNLLLQYINGWSIQSTATSGQANANLLVANVHSVMSGQGFHSLGVTGSSFAGTQHLRNCNMDQIQNGGAYLFEDVSDILAESLFGAVTAGSGKCINIKGHCSNICINNVDIGAEPGPSTGSTVFIETGVNGSPTFVTIAGGTIQGGTAGVTVAAGTNIEIADVQISNNGTFGVNVTGGDILLITGCTFTLNGSAGTTGRYDFQSSTTGHVRVSDCFFLTPQGTGAQQTNNAVNVTAGIVAMSGCPFYGTGYNATNIFNNQPGSIINCPGYGSIPVVPFALFDGDLASSNANAVGVANTAYLVGVELKVPYSLSAIRVRFGTGGTGHYDVGIYDATGANDGAGNLLAHAAATATSLVTVTGAQSPALIAGTRTLVSGNLLLEPGKYWLALWIDNATDTIVRVQGASGMVIVQSGTNAGPLPAAASSLTGLANAIFKPIILGLRTGGWS